MKYSTKSSNLEGLLEKQIKERDHYDLHRRGKNNIRKLKSLSNEEIN